MKPIAHLHDFIEGLPPSVRQEIKSRSSSRLVPRGNAVYRQGDAANELYRLEEGGVKLCNYTADGKEFVTGVFRPGDCFGEMGLIDGMPRLSHAIATRDSRVAVLGKKHFDQLYRAHPEISQQLNLMLCRRLRLVYTLGEEAHSLNLRERLARSIQRLAYSQGFRDEHGARYIDSSHEELSRMLGASRQSISKELKQLEAEGAVELRYGKIYVKDLEALNARYENLSGVEQITAVYDDGM